MRIVLYSLNNKAQLHALLRTIILGQAFIGISKNGAVADGDVVSASGQRCAITSSDGVATHASASCHGCEKKIRRDLR